MTDNPRAEQIVRDVLMSYFTAYAIPGNITLDGDRIDKLATAWVGIILKGTVFAPGLVTALAGAGLLAQQPDKADSWREGYEAAITYAFPSADADNEVLAEFMERADGMNPHAAPDPETMP